MTDLATHCDTVYVHWSMVCSCSFKLSSNISYPILLVGCPAVQGHNGRVVWGAYFQMVFNLVQIWHICTFSLLKVYNFITYLLFGPDFTVRPSPVLCMVQGQSSQSRVFHYFLMFKRVQNIFPPHAAMIQLAWC